MASNPPPSGAQPLHPPAVGSMNPQHFAPPYGMQFQPPGPTQQGHQYMTQPGSQQFHPGQNYGQNMAPQFTQQMQHFPPRPSQPGNVTSMPYQTSYNQQNAPPPNNQPFSSSSYTFHPSMQMQAPVNPPVSVQPWVQSPSQSASVTPLHQTITATPSSASDWQEYEAADGRRYYYNKVTKQSSWEKPEDLMTPTERADASTVWKEFTTPEGRKYYFNKETKQSTWTIPEDLKLAREKAENTDASEMHMESTTPPSNTTGLVPLSPVAVTPVDNPTPMVVTSSSVTPPPPRAMSASPLGDTVTTVTPSSPAISTPGPSNLVNGLENVSPYVSTSPAEKINETPPPQEEKPPEEEQFVYPTKQEAKNAFKALLESANVESDWSWEQAMRVIINDKRYGALRTLGERKQAFNEYLMQRKKLEAEEKRVRQRKAKEEYIKMLEEYEELTSSTRWSKAITMFEGDERFKAVEREADREDLFRNYLVDLQKKEREKAQEEFKRNKLQFRQFLETCGFIKVDTQWRKIQDLLEDDESTGRLEKIDRLEVFQEYIHELEREEEEQRKKQREQMRRGERKNRDAYRSMMEEHIADGTLTAKTTWRDYCLKVKDSAPYQAVASNVSGSTPKNLFEDAWEELDKQYHEDKGRVKDVLKSEKITVASTWTFEDLKTVTEDIIGTPSISDINLQLIYEDLIERAKEKEEKELKKRQRLAKDFTDVLTDIKEINASSTWEEFKQLVEDSSEYRAIGEESTCKEIFEEYVIRLQEKAKEKERKREEDKAKKDKEREEKEKEKKKEKEKREREKVKDRSKRADEDNESMEVEEDNNNTKKEKKHRKRHHTGGNEDVLSDREDKEKEKEESSSKKSRRHGSDRKKSRKHGYSPESDGENRHKKHKRDHNRRNGGGGEELEDGELGEDGEI